MTNASRRRKRASRWLILLIIAVVAISGVRMADRIGRMLDMNEQVKACQVQLVAVQSVYDEKMETLELLDNPAYIERVARENLGMVKQGETIVAVVKTEANDQESPVSDQPENLAAPAGD